MTPKLSRQVLLCSSQWVRRHREHYCVSSRIPLCCISIQLNTSLCRGHGERIMFELIRLNQTRTGCVLPHCLWRHKGSSKIPQFVCSLFFSIFNNLFKFYLPSKTVMFFFCFVFSLTAQPLFSGLALHLSRAGFPHQQEKYFCCAPPRSCSSVAVWICGGDGFMEAALPS